MRRWRGPYIKRGKYFLVPVPPIVVPSYIDPAGPKPKFGSRLLPSSRRRFDPPWFQANQGGPWPSFLRQPYTAYDRGERLLPSNRRRFDPPWPQGTLGQPYPVFTRQASTTYVRGLRLLPSARRRFDPGWGQGNQGKAWPSYIRQPGVSYKRALRLLPDATKRRFDPAWPQGNQGQPWPSYIRQSSTVSKRGIKLVVSRGRRYDPPWPQGPLSRNYATFMRHTGYTKWPSRKGTFQPVVPPLLVVYPPVFTKAPVIKRGLKIPRGKFYLYPVTQGTLGQNYPTFTRQPKTSYARGMRLLPSARRRFDPAWPQANRGSAYPVFTRQAATRKNTIARRGFFLRVNPVVIQPPVPLFTRTSFKTRSLRIPRGKLLQFSLPQANIGQPWPSYIKRQGYGKIPGRHGNYFLVIKTYPPVPPPQYLKHPVLIRGFRLRRGYLFRFNVPQGNITQPYPVWSRQSKVTSRGIRLRRGNIYKHLIAQNNQGVPITTVTRQHATPYRVVKAGPQRRRNFFAVRPVPVYPLVIRPAIRTRNVRLRRGRFYALPLTPPVISTLPYMRQSWRPKLYQRRGRIFRYTFPTPTPTAWRGRLRGSGYLGKVNDNPYEPSGLQQSGPRGLITRSGYKGDFVNNQN